MLPTRRHFLAGTLGTGLAALAPDALASERSARSHASRVLIINLSGGIRSSAAFIASSDKQLNPWGRLAGAKVPLGAVLQPDDGQRGLVIPGPAPSRQRGRRRRRVEPQSVGFVAIPPLSSITDRFSVLGTWDPERGDHLRSERVAHRGNNADNAAGILVRVFGALSERDSRQAPLLPAFELGEAGSASFTPRGFEDGATVQVAGAGQLPRRDDSRLVGASKTGARFLPRSSARDELDRAMLDAMGPGGRPTVLAYTQQRRLAERLSTKLDHEVVRADEATSGQATLGELRIDGRTVPLSNAMLTQAFEGEFGSGDGAEANLRLAVRLLQLGSPAVSVTLGGFDMHSGEEEGAPRLYARLGAMWSALHFVLAHTGDPDDNEASMLDRTLVLTNSEFGRDPGLPRTGFNGGAGSDHGSHPATFYVGHALMGAGTVPGRFFGRVDTKTYDARRSRERYAPSDLLATVLFALGIHSQRWDVSEGRPIRALWGSWA